MQPRLGDNMKKPANPPSVPDVFILESLDGKDERAGRLEGERISNILRLAGKNPKYYYFHSFEELEYALSLFKLSGYRYLHFSTHANSTQVASFMELISYSEFADYFDGVLDRRRLFFSACQIGNENFAKAIADRNPEIHSIAAPSVDVEFSQSIAAWSAFYLSMFAKNEKAMSGKKIQETLDLISQLFPIKFFYASHIIKRNEWKYYSFPAIK